MSRIEVELAVGRNRRGQILEIQVDSRATIIKAIWEEECQTT